MPCTAVPPPISSFPLITSCLVLCLGFCEIPTLITGISMYVHACVYLYIFSHRYIFTAGRYKMDHVLSFPLGHLDWLVLHSCPSSWNWEQVHSYLDIINSIYFNIVITFASDRSVSGTIWLFCKAFKVPYSKPIKMETDNTKVYRRRN